MGDIEGSSVLVVNYPRRKLSGVQFSQVGIVRGDNCPGDTCLGVGPLSGEQLFEVGSIRQGIVWGAMFLVGNCPGGNFLGGGNCPIPELVLHIKRLNSSIILVLFGYMTYLLVKQHMV